MSAIDSDGPLLQHIPRKAGKHVTLSCDQGHGTWHYCFTLDRHKRKILHVINIFGNEVARYRLNDDGDVEEFYEGYNQKPSRWVELPHDKGHENDGFYYNYLRGLLKYVHPNTLLVKRIQ